MVAGSGSPKHVAIVGAGPAGLIAAEQLAASGIHVTIYERMASPARKFLMAGRGGLNLTHSEPIDRFGSRYTERKEALAPALAAFPPSAAVAWTNGLGIETFIGSSGRVFPREMKASPLLRTWLKRLGDLGVSLKTRHDWRGFDDTSQLLFDVNGEIRAISADATILAMGGASWPRLGSNGAWVDILARDGIEIAPLQASNTGVTITWSPHMLRFAGVPLKRIALTMGGAVVRGEVVITHRGLEGGAVYAIGAAIREQLQHHKHTDVLLDHRPDLSAPEIASKLSRPRGKQSTTTYLRKSLALAPANLALLREAGPLPKDPATLAELIKAQPLSVNGLSGLERAISTAGGVSFGAVDANLMLCARPGVFVAGEMLDWDAPTGGYLLQGSFSTGVLAARGALVWLSRAPPIQ